MPVLVMRERAELHAPAAAAQRRLALSTGPAQFRSRRSVQPVIEVAQVMKTHQRMMQLARKYRKMHGLELEGAEPVLARPGRETRAGDARKIRRYPPAREWSSGGMALGWPGCGLERAGLWRRRRCFRWRWSIEQWIGFARFGFGPGRARARCGGARAAMGGHRRCWSGLRRLEPALER